MQIFQESTHAVCKKKTKKKNQETEQKMYHCVNTSFFE